MTSEKFKITLRNRDINFILIGTPTSHRHIRIIMDTKYGTIIFQEATIANLARAYIALKTHPKIRAMMLTLEEMDKEEIKPGYARFQLIESEIDSEKLQEEIDKQCSDR